MKRCVNQISIQCNPKNQYTCWSGQCISLSKRCDKKIDCSDESDEIACQLMLLDDDKYRKANVPGHQKYEKLPIGVWIDVLDIAEVNEPEV